MLHVYVYWRFIGVTQGDDVSVHYDPMIAKLVVWSSDRSSALRKLRSCLSEYNIVGLNTNVDFLMQLSSHPQFVEGDVHTDFIAQHYNELFPSKPITDNLVGQAVLASILNEIKTSSSQQGCSQDPYSPFGSYSMGRINHNYQKSVKVKCQDTTYEVQVTCCEHGQYKLKVGQNADVIDVCAKLSESENVSFIELTANGEITKSRVVFMNEAVHLFTKVLSFTSRMTHVQCPNFCCSSLGWQCIIRDGKTQIFNQPRTRQCKSRRRSGPDARNHRKNFGGRRGRSQARPATAGHDRHENGVCYPRPVGWCD